MKLYWLMVWVCALINYCTCLPVEARGSDLPQLTHRNITCSVIFTLRKELEEFWQMFVKQTAFQEHGVSEEFQCFSEGILWSMCNLVGSKGCKGLSSLHHLKVSEVILDLVALRRNTAVHSAVLLESVNVFSSYCILCCAVDSRLGSGSAMQSDFYYYLILLFC